MLYRHFTISANLNVLELTNCVLLIRSNYLLFAMGLQPSVGYGLLVSRGFLITHNDAPLSVGLFRTSDQLVAETSTWQHTQQTNIHAPMGFEPTNAAGERPYTYALDRAATGTGICGVMVTQVSRPSWYPDFYCHTHNSQPVDNTSGMRIHSIFLSYCVYFCFCFEYPPSSCFTPLKLDVVVNTLNELEKAFMCLLLIFMFLHRAL
jgi:hypothetical protein